MSTLGYVEYYTTIFKVQYLVKSDIICLWKKVLCDLWKRIVACNNLQPLHSNSLVKIFSRLKGSQISIITKTVIMISHVENNHCLTVLVLMESIHNQK